MQTAQIVKSLTATPIIGVIKLIILNGPPKQAYLVRLYIYLAPSCIGF